MPEELWEVSGSVESIHFRNEENGFTVLELNNGAELVTVVGVLPFVSVGEELRVMGQWSNHPQFGPQMKAAFCERSLPATASAVLRYLSSGVIKGVGPATARSIVEAFGGDALKIIEEDPERLASVRGISKHKARQIRDEFIRQFGIREVMLKLGGYGITPDQALRVFKRFGAAAVDVIQQSPYLLCDEAIGIGFERTDAIAMQMGADPAGDERIAAGLRYVLRHNTGNGHTLLPREPLLKTASDLLGCGTDLADIAIDRLLDRHELEPFCMGGREFVALPALLEAERFIAGRLRLMRASPPPPVPYDEADLCAIAHSRGLEQDELQNEAVRCALSEGMLILTGGPGTGKTTTLNAILTLLEGTDRKVLLCAPTGRAAQRMTELCGAPAKTIHRLLEVEWSENNRLRFSKNEQSPLDCDAVVVDELSMVDVTLFEALLRALPAGCRLILVGDADQLPSVGPGNLLQDIMESGLIPTVRLQKVFRQAGQSLIVTNAHKIVAGQPPDLTRRDGDFFLLEEGSSFRAARLVAQLCSERLPAAYGFSPMDDIQVLCPSRKRELGTASLNKALQEKLNPPRDGAREFPHNGFVFREGDKVMQVRNNYDIGWERDDGSDGSGVFNGDIGVLVRVDRAGGVLSVRFDDRTAQYTGDDLNDLEPAYAITIHKSQGSEFDCVVLPLLDMPPPLCYRNLLYTAVTRAKKLLVIVGRRSVVLQMVENNRKNRRYTALRALLKEESHEAEPDPAGT